MCLPENVLIGDCIHNARAALDYLAWEMAGAGPDDRETQFPICLTPTSFKAAHARIAALPAKARTLIERIQPYLTADPAKHVVWALHQLDIADKHKLLTIVAVVVKAGALAFKTRGGGVDASRLRLASPDVGLEHDAVFGEVHVGLPMPEMTVELEITPRVAFGASHGWGTRMFVTDNLQRSSDDVEAIGVLFKQEFSLADS